MTRVLTLYQGADMDPEWDYSDWVEWPDCEFGTRCYDGETAQGDLRVRDLLGETGNATSLPGGLTYRGISARNIMTLTEDASGAEKHIWRGWVIPKDYSRGTQKAARAREISVAIEDNNGELRGIIVGRDAVWSRPIESDVTRVLALLNDFFDGGVRAATVIGDSFVPNTNTVEMPAKDYSDVEPADVLRDCAGAADKRFWVVLNDDGTMDLFYDTFDSAAYASTLAIRQTGTPSEVDGTTTFEPIWDVGPASREDGQGLRSGIKLRGPNDISSYSVSATAETEYNHYEEVLYDDLIASQAEADFKADALIAVREREERTYSCSLLIPATRIHLIKAGMNITIQAKVIPDADDAVVTRRIAQLKFRVYNDTLYKVALQLDRPKRGGAFGSGNKALAVMPSVEPFSPVSCTPGDCTDEFNRASTDPGWPGASIDDLEWVMVDDVHDGAPEADNGARLTIFGKAYLPPPVDPVATVSHFMELPIGLTLPFETLELVELHIPPGGAAGGGPAVDVEAVVNGADFAGAWNQWRWRVIAREDEIGTEISITATAIYSFGGSTIGTDSAEIPGPFAQGRLMWIRREGNSRGMKVKAWYDDNIEPDDWLIDLVINPGGDDMAGPDSYVYRNRITSGEDGGDFYLHSICFLQGAACSDGTCGSCTPPTGAFIALTPVRYGDGALTTFTVLGSGYKAGSLEAEVDGISQLPTETDPAAGEFELSFAPEDDELVLARWRAL